MNKSVKSYSGLDPERCKSAFALPSDIVDMLGALKNLKEIPEGFESAPEYIPNLMTSRQVAMVQGHFGKYLPKGFQKIADKTLVPVEEKWLEGGMIVGDPSGTRMLQVGAFEWVAVKKDECCFPQLRFETEQIQLTPEERLSAHVQIIQELKKNQNYREEMKKVNCAKHSEAFYPVIQPKLHTWDEQMKYIRPENDGDQVSKRCYKQREVTNTKRVRNGDKLEWVDAYVQELPSFTAVMPDAEELEGLEIADRDKIVKMLATSDGQHEPARYIFTMPDGTIVDLNSIQYLENGVLHNETSKRDEAIPLFVHIGELKGKYPNRTYFAPIHRTNPDTAMQSVVTRLGKKMSGGAQEIIQYLTGLENVEPAYMTVWQGGCWVVIVGHKKVGKNTPSSYIMQGDKLKYDITNPKRMTVSEFEHAIISAPSVAEYDEDSETVNASQELDQQLIEQGFQRDRDRYEVDGDQFKDGTELLEQVAFEMNRRNEMLAGEPLWTLIGFRDTLAKVIRGERAEKKRLKAAIRVQRKAFSRAKAALSRAIGAEENKERFKEMKAIERKGYKLLAKLERIGDLRWKLSDMWKQLTPIRGNLHYAQAENLADRKIAFGMMKHPRFMKESVKVIPGASEMPDNQIQLREPILTEVDRIIPAQTLFRPTAQMLRNGTVGVYQLSDGTYSARYAKSSRIAWTTPKNASPALKATLARIMACG